MTHSNRQPLLYTEEEAAQELGVSRALLHKVLDEHVFNDGSLRPAEMTFQAADLFLLDYWLQSAGAANVIAMPKRGK